MKSVASTTGRIFRRTFSILTIRYRAIVLKGTDFRISFGHWHPPFRDYIRGNILSGDYTETIQIDYDPALISYETLLDVFWDSHSPAAPAWSRQYMSIIFYHDEEQKRLAGVSLEREAARIGKKIVTEIRPAGQFYRAEDYHQKYLLSSESEIARELKILYPAADDYVDSTVAARINGYLGSYGTLAELREALPGFGLSPRAAKILTDIVGRRPGRPGCRL